jgi:hypothetical protein
MITYLGPQAPVSLDIEGKITSRISMKPRQQSVLLLAACVLFFGRQMLGAQEVTFEILVSFDYPGAQDTFAGGINDRGDVVGSFVNESNETQSFVRFADGTFSDPIVHPNGVSTYLSDINNTGTMCGSYTRANSTFHGFFLSGSTFTNFDLPGPNTLVRGVNDAGDFCGTTIEKAFVSIDGTISTFAIPRQAITTAAGINNLNQVVGRGAWLQTEYSFRRDADGTMNWPIRAPGSANTGMFGLDDKGRMVGYVTHPGSNTQGVFLRPSRRFAFYAYPGSIFTEFTDINNQGHICGVYESPDLKEHGFIVRVRGDD